MAFKKYSMNAVASRQHLGGCEWVSCMAPVNGACRS